MLILGSQSPRRKEILSFFSLPFRQVSSDYDESILPFARDPAAYASEIAKQKALSLRQKYPKEIILTADTVVYKEGQLFLKPESEKDAFRMVRELSGSEHQVYTGVTVMDQKHTYSDVEMSRVFFNDLTDDEIHKYIKAFHTMDKAGGYAIQQGGSLVVKRIEGCYYNVMGLPLQTVRRLLLKAGINLWDYLKSV